MPDLAPKPGAAREATLNAALGGRGAGGAPLAVLRERARVAYDALELPRWRRSGFWQTSFEDLDLDALAPRTHAPDATLPAILADQRSAGVLVQRDASVVHVELDAELAARGVILCSLETAANEHTELFERYYLRRLMLDRHKLEAASAAFWSGGAFLYVPPGLQIAEPFQIVYEISAAGSAQYAHTLAIGDRGCELRLREYDLATGRSPATRCTPASSSSTSRTARAAASRSSPTGARARSATPRPRWSRSAATPTATGCRRCSAAA